MLTRWGETLDKDTVLQEYPRPQLRAGELIIISTAYGTMPSRPSGDDCRSVVGRRAFVVPFSPEAPLSGAGRGP